MSFLKRLFGGGGGSAPPAAEAETYLGFTIRPDPEATSGGHRIGATIEKDGRSHRLIRADTLASRDDAVAASSAKARQVIDEQGDRLFD